MTRGLFFPGQKRAKYIVVTAYLKSPFSLSVELSVIISVENSFESSSSGEEKELSCLNKAKELAARGVEGAVFL